MAKIVIMPRQGQSVESCIITSWNKKMGDTVATGDVLFSYETDKSAFDENADTDGVILAVFAEEGDDVECLKPVCIIGQAGEDISALMAEAKAALGGDAPAAAPAPAEAPAAAAPAAAAAAEAPAATATEGDIIRISPRAKNLAVKTNADLYEAVATGPNGRIIERDVNALLDAGKTAAPGKVADFLAGKPLDVKAPVAEEKTVLAAPASIDAGEYEEEKLPNIRKVIAKSMHASLSEMAQLTLNASFDATALQNYRASLKENAEKLGLPNITLNDMVCFAVAKTLLGHRSLNAHYLGETMRFFKHVNLGVAVDTDRGLIVPTVFAADTLSLADLAVESKANAVGAKSGSISPDKLKDATFTVSNLGAFGIESFTPVINPPQTAILGVDAISYKLKADGSVYPAMGLSLTFDHRALDGAPAARFLSDLCKNLENFNLLLAK